MSSDIVIQVRNLSKCYEIYEKPQDRLLQMLSRGRKQFFKEFWALRDISFEVKQGETFGIIGRNGSGKSTLLQILAGTLAQTSGEALVKGRVAALLELGSGFNPEFTGRENVYLNGSVLGLTQREIEDRYDQIVEFADIGEFIDQPVKTYSSGMFVRLAFAVQAHIDANIVIIDEALAVGDIFFRQKCYTRLNQLKESGVSILLVSHSMLDIEQFCNHSILLDNGINIFYGNSSETVKHYYLVNQSSGNVISSSIIQFNGSKNLQTQSLKYKLDFWPEDSLFVDATDLTQVSTGGARCTRFIVCDFQGTPQINFSQGETANFYVEFEVLEPLAIPLGGIVIQNDKGVLVHGKGSLEYGTSTPTCVPTGMLVRFRQSVDLKLQIGEYSFELGLATIDSNTYESRSKLGVEELFSKVYRVCHVPNAGVFSVNFRNQIEGSKLTHHGVVDLPGNFQFGFLPKAKDNLL
ncbi:MAG: ABC transporter ATP-binding protein [Synechococcales cyanobacterium]